MVTQERTKDQKIAKYGKISKYFAKKQTYKEFENQGEHQKYVEDLTRTHGVITSGYNQSSKMFFAYSTRIPLVESNRRSKKLRM